MNGHAAAPGNARPFPGQDDWAAATASPGWQFAYLVAFSLSATYASHMAASRLWNGGDGAGAPVMLALALLVAAASGVRVTALARSHRLAFQSLTAFTSEITVDPLRAAMPRLPGEAGAAAEALSTLRDAMLPILSRDGVLLVDGDGTVTAALGRVAAVFGDAGACPAVGSTYGSFLAWLADRGLIVPGPAEVPRDVLEGLCRHLDTEADLRLPGDRWARLRSVAVGMGGRAVHLSDITADKRREVALASANVSLDAAVSHGRWRDGELQRANGRLDAALSNMVQGLAMFAPDNKLLMANSQFARIFNLPPRALFPGLSLDRLAALSVHAGNHPEGSAATSAALLCGSAPADALRKARIGNRVVSVLRSATKDGGSVVTYEDVTERTRAEEHVHYLAHHDALTGLANRLLLGQRLDQALDRRTPGMGVAVLCMDLDRFKAVNDTYGHAIGDLLLKEVSARIQACVRGSDTVARLGGDEFVVVLVQTHVATRDDAAEIAQRIIAALAQPFVLDGVRVSTGTSVGVAVSSPGDVNPDPARLVEQADFALYSVKSTGRGKHCFFEPGMDVERQDRIEIEAELALAMERGEMEIRYQPVVQARTGRITAFEALLRWRHPTRGVVAAAGFIPMAEKAGKLPQVGEWALREACRQAATWPEDIGVAVNLAPSQFRNPGFALVVQDALSAAGIGAGRLELEIGETVLLAADPLVRTTLARLTAIGVKISIDDFAGRHTCLRHLLDFRFHRLKIDQDFLKEFPAQGRDSTTVLEALLNVGRNLRTMVTVEGIETEEDLMFVARNGCDDIQGYYLSPPIEAAEVAGLIDARAGHPAAFVKNGPDRKPPAA